MWWKPMCSAAFCNNDAFRNILRILYLVTNSIIPFFLNFFVCFCDKVDIIKIFVKVLLQIV